MKPILTCLDFVPTEDQLALMKRAHSNDDRDAFLDLAMQNILFLPELGAWFGSADQHIEDYRCGRISADECKSHFPTPMYR